MIVINRESGAAKEVWSPEFERAMLAALRENGWAPELRLVSGPEIGAAVEEARRSEAKAVIAGGGDGTTSAIAGQMLDSETALGVLPFGTLNFAARDLGSPLDPLEAVKALRPGRVRKIDILEVNGHACLCMTVIGVYPRLLEKAGEYHGRNWWVKFGRLARQIYHSYLEAPIFEIRMKLDGEDTKTVRTRFLLLTPGGYEDEWGLLPHRAELDTGCCCAYVSKHLSRWSVLRMTLRFMTGRSRNDPDLQVIEASRIQLSVKNRQRVKAAIDGELCVLDLPAEFNLARRTLKVLDPAKPD